MKREDIINELTYAPCEAFIEGTKVELSSNVILETNSLFPIKGKNISSKKTSTALFLVSFISNAMYEALELAKYVGVIPLIPAKVFITTDGLAKSVKFVTV